MIRQNIILGDYIYICDLYHSFLDNDELHDYSQQYVMLRKFNITNNIVYDTDIFFVEKDLLNEVLNSSDKTLMAWPVENNGLINFSTQINDYNNNLWIDTIDDGDVYKIYEDRDCKIEANIKCNKMRIYHPSIKAKLNAIVYIDNYINNIHFHYFCKRLDHLPNNAETVFKIGNQSYSEYVEFYFPCIEDLFFKTKIAGKALNGEDDTYEYKYFFKENYNLVFEQLEEMKIEDGSPVYTPKLIVTDKGVSVDLRKVNIDPSDPKKVLGLGLPYLLDPFEIGNTTVEVEKKSIVDGHEVIDYELKDVTVKIYKSSLRSMVYNNYWQHPFNLTIAPYNGINTTTSIYKMDDYLRPNTDVFTYEQKFSLKSRIGFNKAGALCVINEFEYPNKEYFAKAEIQFNTDEDGNIISEKSPVQKAYEYYNNVKFSEYKNYYTPEDYDQYEIGDTIELIGYNIAIASDVNITPSTLIYQANENNIIIDDFEFELNNIFNRWEQLPDVLVIRCSYIDKYLGMMIAGNFVTISKEQFKYLVNITNIPKVNLMKNFENGEFAFIDKINCIVEHKSAQMENADQLSISNKPTIMYQPIFYKVQDLQTLRIRSGVTQNIGINLGNYMTKVEVFKLNIDGLTYIEFSRNDIYVIFKVEAVKFENQTGKYDITNQDDEYISSGSWQIY